MQQGDQVEVLEPLSLREQMRNLAKTLTHYYKENK
jgi:predicted DNA-binding transcriptional regulator YafY